MMTIMEMKKLMKDGISVKEFALLTGMSESTVRIKLKNGSLPYLKKERLFQSTRYTLSRDLADNMSKVGWQQAIDDWKEKDA